MNFIYCGIAGNPNIMSKGEGAPATGELKSTFPFDRPLLPGGGGQLKVNWVSSIGYGANHISIIELPGGSDGVTFILLAD
jgi:hypothetical protein